MAQRSISARTYVVVCAVLILLTFLTLGVSLFPLEGIWHLILGLAIAACKGALVVLFFMHAIASPKLTWAVIAVACFWVGILFVLTLSDYMGRGMVPLAPGH